MASKDPTSSAPGRYENAVHPDRQPLTGISILIIGAGVGGIISALECWRKGHTVRILERSHGPVETGQFKYPHILSGMLI